MNIQARNSLHWNGFSSYLNIAHPCHRSPTPIPIGSVSCFGLNVKKKNYARTKQWHTTWFEDSKRSTFFLVYWNDVCILARLKFMHTKLDCISRSPIRLVSVSVCIFGLKLCASCSCSWTVVIVLEMLKCAPKCKCIAKKCAGKLLIFWSTFSAISHLNYRLHQKSQQL